MATIKKITTEDVMTALREDGKIVSYCQDADETFSVSRDQSDYFGEHDAEHPDDWGACCAATEGVDD